jgi:LysR family transcriptional regulator, regulator for bpeEF and oprC
MESLRCISTFIRVVQLGNFSRAARELGITPQAASIHIKRLESWTGVQLFNRSTRKVSLTDNGANFYRTCVTAFGAIEEDVGRMRDSAGEMSGTVRLSTPAGLGSRFVAPALSRFMEQFPKVQVDLLVQNRIPDVVGEGIDVGILPHPLPDTTLVARRVITSPFVLCASSVYLRRHGRPTTVDELQRHRRVDLRSWVSNTVRPWRLRRDNEIVTCTSRASLVTNDADSLVEALLSGAGIGLSALYRVVPYLRSGRLETVLDGMVDGELSWSLYMPQRTHVPRRVRALVDFLYEVLRSHPDLQEPASAVVLGAAPVPAASTSEG